MANYYQDKIEKGIEAGLRVKPYFHFDPDQEWAQFSNTLESNPAVKVVSIQPGKRNVSILSIMAYAALFAGILVVLGIITRPVQFTDTRITRNNTDSITLFDGSVVVMDKNTIIKYPTRAKDIVVRRVVIEKGKATFRVAQNKIPFVVSAYPMEITATGTVFTVEKTSTTVQIINQEGRIEVSPKNEKMKPIVLTKGEKAKRTQGEIFVAKPGEEFRQITFNTFVSQMKLEKIKKDSIALVVSKQKTEKSAAPLKGSQYRVTDVIDFLEKNHPKKLKFKKKKKIKTNTVVSIHLNQPLESILSLLKEQGHLEYETGKCEGCFLLSPPVKKKK